MAKQVQTDRMILVARVEVDHAIGARWCKIIKQIFSEVAVGIDDGKRDAGVDELKRQIPDQRALSGSGLSHEMQVLTKIVARNAERLRTAPHLSVADKEYVVVVHDAGTSPHSIATILRRVIEERMR